ncbi:MAG: DNA-binding domain-containing protein [Pseudomonadota bacterium]
MLETIQKTLIEDIHNVSRNLAPYLDESIANIGARIDIFANNRKFGHLDLLASIYPTTKQLLGEDFFDAIAKDFIAGTAQASGNRHEYGGDFARFLASHSRLEKMQYVGEVAAIEWMHFGANLADDAAAITIGEIAAKMEAGEVFGLALHPSATHISCNWNALEICQAHQKLPFEGIELQASKSNLLCWRDQDDEVLFSKISDDFSNLLLMSQLKTNFGVALSEAILSQESSSETSIFQTEFAQLTDAGIFTISKEN